MTRSIFHNFVRRAHQSILQILRALHIRPTPPPQQLDLFDGITQVHLAHSRNRHTDQRFSR